MNFGLIGDGYIASRHKKAIEEIGGKIKSIYDPLLYNTKLNKDFFNNLDYVIICSPSHYHKRFTSISLNYDKKVIVEKPATLPTQELVIDDRISVVFQLRWLDLENIDKIKVVAYRDDNYFKSWRGYEEMSGGLFSEFFIHYIDLAMLYNCECEFEVIRTNEKNNKQVRKIGSIDLFKVNMDKLYAKMYVDIINDNGIKTKDLLDLHRLVKMCSKRYKDSQIINKKLIINPNSGVLKCQ